MVTDHSGIGPQSDNETGKYVRLAVIGARVMGADPKKPHPLTYAKKGYANLKATCEQVGFKLA